MLIDSRTAQLAVLRASAAGLAMAMCLAAPSPVQAQALPPGAAPETAADGAQPAADPAMAEEEIVVTGSLIRNPNLEQSSPVAVIGAEEIELQQANVAEELLRELPGAVPSIGSAVNNGNGGQSFVDLRGLGINRNLVLLDGVRVVPGNLGGVFDLNNIPLALVERVDVLTGGASTTYGADAVSGVVNFITVDDFEGAEISASQQITERGDGNTLRADVTVGANFADERGNAVLSVGYQEADPVYQGARNLSASSLSSLTGAAEGSGTSVPSRFSLRGVGTRQIDPGSGALVPTFATFNFNPFNIFQTPFRRYNLYGSGNYEVADGIEVYARGLFSKNIVQTIVAPSGIFNAQVTIPLSNPFLPAAARNQFCAQDTDPNTPGVQRLYGQAECDAAAGATNPNDPNYRTVSTNLSRRSVELGTRDREFTNNVFDYRAGVRGDLTDTLNFDLFGGYGQSENRQLDEGYVLLSRVRQALLATNADTCLNAANGCAPLNVFGPAGSITGEMADFLRGQASTLTIVSLGQARGLISGDLGFSSPLASDPIGIAVGAEYRKYSAEVQPDSIVSIPGELGGFGGANVAVDGGFDVREVFGELVAPLIADRPFFHNLTLEAGLRHSRYSVDAAGNPKFSTTTYKVGGSWEPVSSLKIRGTYSRAVRAPNIAELFTPVGVGLTNLNTDPCAGSAPLANANLRAICLAQGAPVSSIGNISNPSAGQANLSAGGDINLKPEKADSFTVGAVFQPDFIPGLAVTLDYYDIKITDAITAPTPADIIAACFGATPTAPPPNAADPACTSIRRNPNTGGLDGNPGETPGLFAVLSNTGRVKTSGVDLGLSYRKELGFAKLNLGFNGNYTRESKFQAKAGSINRECAGYYSVSCGSPASPVIGSIQPKYSFNQRTTLDFGGIDVSLLWRYIHKVRFEPQQLADDIAAAQAAPGDCPDPLGTDPGGCIINPEFRRIGSRHYFDLTTRFSVTDKFTFTLTVQNLLDKQPPVVGNSVGSTTFNSGNTYPSTYDALGRRFAIGAKLTF